jgi:phosphoesterase RecJ-like protein
MAADLTERGANAAQIAEIVWGSRSPTAVKLAALVLSTINYEFDGRLAWNEVTRQMLDSAGGDEAELEGLSGEMRAIEGVQVAVLLSETPEGECRIGFRSKGMVNVSTLARMLGGGGHKSASGATISEPYLPAKQRALEVIRQYLRQELPSQTY